MAEGSGIVSRNADVMGGTAVFSGTRVPVQTLVDCLEAGETIDVFLEGFPSVHRDQVIAFLETARDLVIAGPSEDLARRMRRLKTGEAYRRA